jgi:hypothetical protein
MNKDVSTVVGEKRWLPCPENSTWRGEHAHGYVKFLHGPDPSLIEILRSRPAIPATWDQPSSDPCAATTAHYWIAAIFCECVVSEVVEATVEMDEVIFQTRPNLR